MPTMNDGSGLFGTQTRVLFRVEKLFPNGVDIDMTTVFGY
jgi:hypothetical protein